MRQTAHWHHQLCQCLPSGLRPWVSAAQGLLKVAHSDTLSRLRPRSQRGGRPAHSDDIFLLQYWNFSVIHSNPMFDISRAQVKNISGLEILSIYKFLLVRSFVSHLFLPYVHCACAHTPGYINVCMFDLASCYLGDKFFLLQRCSLFGLKRKNLWY